MRLLIPRKARLDHLAGSIIRSRGYCQNDINCFSRSREVSARYKEIVWSHIIKRGVLHLRWRLDNALALCLACEMYFTDHPKEHEKFLIEKIGQLKYDELKMSSWANEKVDYGKIEYDLKKEMKRLGTVKATGSGLYKVLVD